ncbi:uncharacterized protein LOC126610122 isoform X3 [Malus sylvestris]|uniref:uncharacterized protein LOC126610122 isoform X3 n=1 Tax=Malus sylvestris TaxID=3752 RepID=UPI0021ACCEEA|nr:uncharacterized protein LOC126610122 isoform X3 [Malus sylvestris]
MTKAFPRISLSRSSLRLPLSHLKLKGMATLAAAAARQLATSSRISTARTSSLPSNIIHRRGLAGAADHHGPPRVNVWQDPLSPSKWKEEHFVIVFSTFAVCNCIFIWLGSTHLWRLQVFHWRQRQERRAYRFGSLCVCAC